MQGSWLKQGFWTFKGNRSGQINLSNPLNSDEYISSQTLPSTFIFFLFFQENKSFSSLLPITASSLMSSVLSS